MKEGIVVPEYNELSKIGKGLLHEQLEYLSHLADEGYEVKLVDDHSTDGSWKMIQNYMKDNKPGFEALRMEQNTQKVGAIKRGVAKTAAEYVLLTDFDSRIENAEALDKVVEKMEAREKIAGAALKVIPEESTFLGRLQDLDYAIGRTIGANYLKKQKKLRCVAGAGGLWKRKILQELLEEHSGRHNGDDMETTAIAMRKGYDIIYAPEVIIKTKTPRTYRELIKQRRRWELGALETFRKEMGFYLKEVKNLKNRFGHITLWEWYNWVSLPLATSLLPYSSLTGDPSIVYYYLGDLGFTFFVSYFAKDEIKDKKELLLIPFMPIYRATVSFPSKILAGYKFLKSILQ